MAVDHVDLIQLHNLVEDDEWETAFAPGGAVEALAERLADLDALGKADAGDARVVLGLLADQPEIQRDGEFCWCWMTGSVSAMTAAFDGEYAPTIGFAR